MSETVDKKADSTIAPKSAAGGDTLNRRQLQRRIKQSNFEETERKRRKALYGTRASSKIFESAAITSRRTWVNGINKNAVEMDNKVTS